MKFIKLLILKMEKNYKPNYFFSGFVTKILKEIVVTPKQIFKHFFF